MIKNYIPINRAIFEHPFWCEDRSFSKFEAWLDILQMARFEDSMQKRIIGNKIVQWDRGQFPGSLRYLAKRWNWSTKKVINYLTLLLSEGMIVKNTVKETGQTIITICNYDKYNFVEEKRKHQRKQGGNSMETPWKQGGNKTNKENKGNKGNKLDSGEGISPPPNKILSSEEKKEIMRIRYKNGLAQELLALFPNPSKEQTEELHRFIAYWCEPNKTLTKMRFELETTWNTHLRVKRWFTNSRVFESSKLPI